MRSLFKKEESAQLPVAEVVIDEVVLDISEPVYTIVEKVKENPKRLKIELLSEGHNYGRFRVVDRKTEVEVEFSWAYNLNMQGLWVTDRYLTSSDITLTQDEIKYIIKELLPYHKERGLYLEKLKQTRKYKQEKISRNKMLKLWEDS